MSKKATGRDNITKKSPVNQGSFNAEAFFNNSSQTVDQTPSVPESDEMFNAMDLEQQFLQPKKEFNEQEALNFLRGAFKETAKSAKKYTSTNQDSTNKFDFQSEIRKQYK